MHVVVKILLVTFLSTLFISKTFANEPRPTAPISGFARSFLADTPIANANITILETGQKFKTDRNGNYGPIEYPVGKPITLLFEKFGYQTVQSATVIVPPEGLTTPYNNITFQVPSTIAYYFLAAVIGARIDSNSCHVATTITSFHKTLNDIPQGEAQAHIVLSPSINTDPFYFDIFKSGPMKGKTNPFTRGLGASTDDGGVAFFNLPPRAEPYKLTAEKSGVQFNEVQFICRKGVFVNLSPPRGPTALIEQAKNPA